MQNEMKERVQRVREISGMRGFSGVLVVGRAPDRNGDLLYLCEHVPMLAGHPSRFPVRGRGLGILYVPTDSKQGLQLAVSTPFYMPGFGVEKTIPNPNIVAAVSEILKDVGALGQTVGIVGTGLVSRGQQTLPVTLKGVEPARLSAIAPIDDALVEGEARLGLNDVLIGRKLASDLGIRVGQPIFIASDQGRERTLTVRGLYSTGVDSLDARLDTRLAGLGAEDGLKRDALTARRFERHDWP